MISETYTQRFDRFQKQAVAAICRDFEETPAGRFLLVIPTGGGKTFTAVKSVNALFEKKLLDPVKDRVLWTAHRVELLSQASDTFVKYEMAYSDRPSFKDSVDFRMIGAVSTSLLQNENFKLVVIDEAHHGAANSYLPIFARTRLGVLGLTATPTRHDGKPLEFDRESFSIGFPDLVDMGVVLRPEVRTVQGGTYQISQLTGDDDLETLNNSSRNKRIVDGILENEADYNKVIVYVGTKQHVKDLYADLRGSRLAGKYDSISYITGDGNSRNQDRDDYFIQEKTYQRSIIVNIDVLTEGYDDPSINTVVMARPTASKLVYMQSMGRAIRHDPNNDLKKAFILEIADVLPNIRYRIDNRWLYSDISDALEPEVIDRSFSHSQEFHQILSSVYTEYNVPENHRSYPEYREHFRYTLLLFKVYGGKSDGYFHFPILIDNENRPKVSNMFNFLSERMPTYLKNGVNREQAFRMIDHRDVPGMESELKRSFVFEAMENSVSTDPAYASGRPWLTFATFRYFQDEEDVPAEIMSFVSDLINKDEILEQIKSKSYLPDSYVIKYPLPLSAFVGKIVPPDEFDAIDQVVTKLSEVKAKTRSSDHRPLVNEILNYSLLPVEPIYSQSLVQIVREDIEYFLKLT